MPKTAFGKSSWNGLDSEWIFLFHGSESNYWSERMAWFISAYMKWNLQLCVVYVVLKSRGLVVSNPMILCPMRPVAHLSADLVHSSGGPHTLTCFACQVGKLQLIYLKCPSMGSIWWGSWLIFCGNAYMIPHLFHCLDWVHMAVKQGRGKECMGTIQGPWSILILIWSYLFANNIFKYNSYIV